jgi:hypothetical protein
VCKALDAIFDRPFHRPAAPRRLTLVFAVTGFLCPGGLCAADSDLARLVTGSKTLGTSAKASCSYSIMSGGVDCCIGSEDEAVDAGGSGV